MSRRVVIIGAGFGGAYCARALERATRSLDVEIVLTDRNNYFAFYPLLVEAGTGSLEPRHVVVPVRSFLRRARFRMGEVSAVDLARREVTLRLAGSEIVETLAYDQLVLALGSVTRVPDVPGLREHAFELKSLADAVALRDRAVTMLEAADAAADATLRRRLLHFVVVGANFTGVEVAGEFHVYLRQAARRYRNLTPDDCSVTLVELGDRILPALDRDLAEYAAAAMRRRGIDIRLRTSVERIEADRVLLRDGAALAAATTIWCAGIAPNPLARTIGVPLDARGYIVCARDLRVQGADHVWAIGDCAVNLDREGKPYPATAQHATRQGQHLAGNIARALSGRAALPFDYTSQGALAALGCRTGVAKIFGLKLSGFPAWFLWRTVYLIKMPGITRKLRVALDWTLDLVFRRDFVQLGVHRGKLGA